MSIRIVALMAVLLAASAQAAPLPPAGEGALARIDRAHAEGRIDDATHALLGFRLALSPRTLPEEFRPAADEAPIRCGTLLARRAFLLDKAGVFTPEQHAEFAALGSRPSMPNSIAVMNGAASPIAIVHYGTNVTALKAQEIADYLSESWDAEFTTMGWRVPPPDVGAGGADPDVTYDLYLDPGKFGAVTIPIQQDTCADPWACTASFIILEPGVPNVETYVAHELNHGSQFAYDYSDGDFIYEATAVWMEDHVYDSVNDWEYFIAGFQNNPSQTISFSTYSSDYMYGGAVFFFYLSDVYDGGGTTLVRDVWDGLKQPNTADWFDGVMTAMSGEGFDSFADVYDEFAGYRLLTGNRSNGELEEGSSMSAVGIEAGFDYSNLDSGETTDPPRGLGANYIVLSSFGAAEGDSVTLHVSSDEPGPWSITAIAMPAAGSATLIVFPDDDDNGKVEATVPDVSLYDEIGFAITNAANLADGADSSFGPGGHSVDLTSHAFKWSFGGGGDDAVGCGCQIPAGRRAPSALSVIAAFVAVAGSIVLRRRT
jgi:hypothetical protein